GVKLPTTPDERIWRYGRSLVFMVGLARRGPQMRRSSTVSFSRTVGSGSSFQLSTLPGIDQTWPLVVEVVYPPPSPTGTWSFDGTSGTAVGSRFGSGPELRLRPSPAPAGGRVTEIPGSRPAGEVLGQRAVQGGQRTGTAVPGGDPGLRRCLRRQHRTVA